MPRTRIKICGVMRPQDGALAQSAGADAIGMIFHPPARRNITLQAARQIIAALGPFVTPVGVFVDATTQRTWDVAEQLGLRIVQLNGHEAPAQALELRQHGVRVIKAIRVDGGLDAELEKWRLLHRQSDALAAIVFETAGTHGGSGQSNDWQAIAALRDRGALSDLPPMIVAGGLCPENVGEVVRMLRPWAVDVSSGVEAEHGSKSAAKVQEFVRRIREAEAGAPV